MKTWIALVSLVVVVFASGYLHRSPNGERSFTMEGKKTVVCGEVTVPFDTRADRVRARGVQKDCGIFSGWKDGHGKGGPDRKPAIEL